RSDIATNVTGRPARRAVPAAMRVKSDGILRKGASLRRGSPRKTRGEARAFPCAARADGPRSCCPTARASAREEEEAVAHVEDAQREEPPEGAAPAPRR